MIDTEGDAVAATGDGLRASFTIGVAAASESPPATASCTLSALEEHDSRSGNGYYSSHRDILTKILVSMLVLLG